MTTSSLRASSLRLCTIALLLLSACGDSSPKERKGDNRDAGAPDSAADDATRCTAGTLDCACEAGGACVDGLICDGRQAICRAATACDGRCVEHQLCTAGQSGDAVCESACESGYRWDPVTSSCLAEPSCEPQAPRSLGQSCAYDNRRCDDSTGTATCGACLEGASLVGGKCVATSCATLACQAPQVCVADSSDSARCGACEKGYAWSETKKQCFLSCYDGLKCKSDQVCVEGEGEADATCKPRTGCDVGEVEDKAGSCSDCTKCYDHSSDTPTLLTGVTGIANGGRQMQNKCVCALENGFFQDVSGDVSVCDSDGDGWVNRRFTELGSQKSVFAKEAKCEVPRIDRFVLRSDDAPGDDVSGVTSEHQVTVSELVTTHNLPSDAFKEAENVKVLELVENEALDEPLLFETRYKDSSSDSLRLRPYGNGQGKFGPAHANPLTKVCNHDFDDFNMDKVADVEQAQGTPYSPASGAAFFQMAYFVELAHGTLVKNLDNSFYSYVITERPRVRSKPNALPFALADADPDTRDQYAEKCLRSRDTTYRGMADDVPNADRIGFDFARYQCAADGGGCSVSSTDPKCDGPKPPTWCKHVAYDGRDPEYRAALELGGDAEWDVPPDVGYDVRAELWPGMNHHSQFKCQSSSNAEKVQKSSPNRVLDLANAGTWKRFDCSLQSSSPLGGEPAWDCVPRVTPRTPSGTQNYWAAVAYGANSGPYARGCIDEHREWGFACGAWSGRTSTGDKPFDVQALASGRFTCKGDCTRAGLFLSTSSGGLCCYGAPDECEEDFFADKAYSLLCGLDQSAATAHATQTCAEMLGDFVWAHDPGSALDDEHDPNVMLWAGPTEPESLRGSVWTGCDVSRSCSK